MESRVSKNIRWGLLSTARVTESLIEPIRQASRSELVAVASRDLDKAQAFAKAKDILKAYGKYEDLLTDAEVDVIYNALPNALHAEWTIRAAEAGKHVLCEKPIVTTLAELDAVEKAAKSIDVVVFEGLKHLHHPQVLRVKEMIQSGRLGAVHLINSCFGFYLPLKDKKNIRFSPKLGGGALWDVGVYPNSLAILIAQAGPPVEVWAHQVMGETSVDVSMTGLMRFENGVAAQISCGFCFPHRYQHTSIVGSAGLIQMSTLWRPDSQNSGLVFVSENHAEEISIPETNPYLCEVEAMEACVLDGVEPVIPLDLSRDFLRSALALRLSASTGRLVGTQGLK